MQTASGDRTRLGMRFPGHRAVETQLSATTGVGDAAQSGAEGSQCLDVGLGEGGGPVSGLRSSE